MKKDAGTVLLIFASAFLLRLCYAVPGIMDPELLMRPDSATYLIPAASLAENGTYCGPGMIPTALRVPLYPLFLSFFLKGGLNLCVVMNTLISTAAVPLIFLCAEEWGLSRKQSLFAAFLFAVSPTAVALGPMFLSDGLFATMIALQMLFFIRYLKKGCRLSDLLLCVFVSGLGTLTRPLNLLWVIFPFLAVFTERIPLKKRFIKSAGVLLLSVCMVAPWIIRNHSIGWGWRLDAVSADSLKHNAAAVMIRLTGGNGEKIRQDYEAYFERTFKSDPARFATEDAKLTFREQTLSAVIREHPFLYLRGFWNPVNLAPDIPNFTGNLGMGKNNIGTWDVIQSKGVFAGAVHYFKANAGAMLLLLPLSLILLVTYGLAAYRFVRAIQHREWTVLYLFAAFFFYYITVTGPVAYPRFGLPVLPWLVLTAASKRFFSRHKNYFSPHN